jgi:hypothetical protein
MWYFSFFFVLLAVLCLSISQREGLTIHLDTDTIQRNIWLPAYRNILGFIPFKYQYRKARQYFKSS